MEEKEPQTDCSRKERKKNEMNRFTYNRIVHLNAALREKELPYRIDYRDEHTAGIWPLGICASIGREEEMRAEIRNFFRKEGVDIFFTEDGTRICTAEQNGDS